MDRTIQFKFLLKARELEYIPPSTANIVQYQRACHLFDVLTTKTELQNGLTESERNKKSGEFIQLVDEILKLQMFYDEINKLDDVQNQLRELEKEVSEENLKELQNHINNLSERLKTL